MTQLLLFPSAVESSTCRLPSTVAIEPSTVATEAVVPALSRVSQSITESTKVDSPAGSDPRPGVHHMGDLARLVLLRYDLVAQRRARRRKVAGK